MFRGDGVIVGGPRVRLEPTSTGHAQRGNMRPVGLAVDRCGKAVGPSCDDR